MKDSSIHVSFRISRVQYEKANRLVEAGVFQDRAELFRQALRDLLQKFSEVKTKAAAG